MLHRRLPAVLALTNPPSRLRRARIACRCLSNVGDLSSAEGHVSWMHNEWKLMQKTPISREGSSTGSLPPISPLVRPHDDPELIKAGKAIASLGISPQHVHVWYSPYVRTQQTMDLVLKVAYGNHPKSYLLQKRESILLREQEFGDWDNMDDVNMQTENPRRYKALLQAKDAYNKFYFRYPNGESRADVVQRATLFTNKLFRGFRQHHIVFLHGVTQRAMRTALANFTVDWFESEPNPPNGSVLIMRRSSEKDSGQRWSEQWLRWIDCGGGGGFSAEFGKSSAR